MTIAKYAAAALLGTALISGTALAQTATPSTPSTTATAPSAATQDFKDNWRTSKLVGLSVYNEANEKLGSISELLTDKSGKITAAIIGVGGFLGVGQHDIAVNFDQLKWVDEPVKATTASTDKTPATPGSSGMSKSTTVGTSSGSGMASTTKNDWYPDHAMMSGTKEQLKAMPQFKYSEASK